MGPSHAKLLLSKRTGWNLSIQGIRWGSATFWKYYHHQQQQTKHNTKTMINNQRPTSAISSNSNNKNDNYNSISKQPTTSNNKQKLKQAKTGNSKSHKSGHNSSGSRSCCFNSKRNSRTTATGTATIRTTATIRKRSTASCHGQLSRPVAPHPRWARAQPGVPSPHQSGCRSKWCAHRVPSSDLSKRKHVSKKEHIRKTCCQAWDDIVPMQTTTAQLQLMKLQEPENFRWFDADWKTSLTQPRSIAQITYSVCRRRGSLHTLFPKKMLKTYMGSDQKLQEASQRHVCLARMPLWSAHDTSTWDLINLRQRSKTIPDTAQKSLPALLFCKHANCTSNSRGKKHCIFSELHFCTWHFALPHTASHVTQIDQDTLTHMPVTRDSVSPGKNMKEICFRIINEVWQSDEIRDYLARSCKWKSKCISVVRFSAETWKQQLRRLLVMGSALFLQISDNWMIKISIPEHQLVPWRLPKLSLATQTVAKCPPN